MIAMSKGAVGSVLDTKTPRICVVNAHASLVIPQVITPLRVSGRTMQKRTSKRETWTKNNMIFRTIFLGGKRERKKKKERKICDVL